VRDVGVRQPHEDEEASRAGGAGVIGSILNSPRKRRRLAWAILLPATLVSLVVVGIAVMPEAKEDPPEVWEDRAAINAAAQDVPVKLRPADRREVNRAIDLFINAAVKREQPGRAYAVATPNLRRQATREEWRKGDIPIYPYPAKGNRFHGWTINYSHRDHLNVDVLVMPSRNRATLGPIAFQVDLRKIDGRWLIDALAPIATFAPIPPQGNRGPVISTADLMPVQAAARPTGAKSRMSYAWFLIPAGIMGAAFALVAGIIFSGMIRDRRARRRYDHDRSLPPLPLSRTD
jgi:hypothetical protein